MASNSYEMMEQFRLECKTSIPDLSAPLVRAGPLLFHFEVSRQIVEHQTEMITSEAPQFRMLFLPVVGADQGAKMRRVWTEPSL